MSSRARVPLPFSLNNGDGSERRDLRITADAVSYRNRTIPIVGMVSVSYLVMDMSVNFVPTGQVHKITFVGRESKITFSIVGAPIAKKGTKAALRESWRDLLAAVKTTVEPPIRARLLEAIQRGEEITIGTVVATAEGFVSKRFPLPSRSFGWEEFSGVSFADGQVIGLGTAVSGVRPTLFKVKLAKPNAPLIPELFSEATGRFGGAPL